MKHSSSLAAAILCLAIVGLSTCSVRQDLGGRMGPFIKPVGGNINSLISGIKTFSFDQTVDLKSSEVEGFGPNTIVTYNLLTGAHISTARSLKGKRRTVLKALPVPVIPIKFTPFKGLVELKFGKHYQRVLVEQEIRAPGASVGKVTAQEGKREGSSVQYVAAYGWSVGNALQLYNRNKVRKCKKILFIKKCHDEWQNIPRGFTPNEIQEVENALHNPILNQLRDKLNTGRLLRIIKNAKAWEMPGNMNQVQLLSGVRFGDVNHALNHLIGSQINLPRSLLATERHLEVTDEYGRKHFVNQKFNRNSVDLRVFSSV